MKKKLVKRWLDALKSGDYKKGRLSLYDSNTQTYCCLGVLLEVCGAGAKRHQNSKAELINDDLASLLGITEDQQTSLALINDHFDSFEPVIKKIKTMFKV